MKWKALQTEGLHPELSTLSVALGGEVASHPRTGACGKTGHSQCLPAPRYSQESSPCVCRASDGCRRAA